MRLHEYLKKHAGPPIPDQPPGDWEVSDDPHINYEHPTGLKIDIGKTMGGWFRVDLLTPQSRGIIGSGDSEQEAIYVAFDHMKKNP